jgi:hypothetical protein
LLASQRLRAETTALKALLQGTVHRSTGSYDGRSAGAKARIKPRCRDREVNESLVLQQEIETKFER